MPISINRSQIVCFSAKRTGGKQRRAQGAVGGDRTQGREVTHTVVVRIVTTTEQVVAAAVALARGRGGALGVRDGPHAAESDGLVVAFLLLTC